MANYTTSFGNWSELEAVLSASEAFRSSTTYNNIDSALNSLMSYASGTPSSSSWTTTTGILYYPGGVTSSVYGSNFGSSNAVISRMDITNGSVTISMTGSVNAQDLSGAFTRADLSGYGYSEYQTGYLTINGTPALVSSWGMTVPTVLGNVTFSSTGTGTDASGAWTWTYNSTSVTDAAGHSAQLGGLNFGLNQENSTPIDLRQTLIDMLSGNDSAVGTAIAQELRGYAGDDFLDGQAGADTLIGGQGNDKYALDDVGDTIIEIGNEGIDGVISTVAISLPANVENLALTGTGAISGTGNDLGNRIFGNGSANILRGNGGNDVIDGRGGIDRAIFSGPVSGYSLATDGKGRIVVADTDPGNGDDGTDTVTNIEELAFADTTVGIKGPVEATVSTDGFPQKSDIAQTGEGYVVAWGADPSGAAGPGIYAQRYDIDGNALGVPMLVNSTGLGGTVTPSVSTLSDGGFVVGWSYTIYPTTATTGIFAQRFDANGVQMGSEVRIDSVPGWISDSPRIAGLANGGFVAAWMSSNGQDGDGRGIYARSYDSNGEPVTAEFRVNTYTTNEQTMPDVAALQDGGYMVTWTSYQPVANPYQVGTNIYAQRYDASGGAVGGETLINTNTSYLYGKSGSKLAVLEDGSYVVAWTSHGQDGSYYGVYARRYDAAGQPRGGEFIVNTTTVQGQYLNDITALDDGGYAITWLSQDGSDAGVFLQRFDINDQPVAGETQVNLVTFGFQSNAAITGLPDGGYGIVWGGIGPGTSWGLLKQQFDANGVELFPGVIHELSGGSSADLLNWTDNASVRLLDDAGNDSLSGGGGADLISAGIGDDLLQGELGNDTLDGGAGNDVAQYAGSKAEYAVTKVSASQYAIVDVNAANGDEGADTLSGIEQLQFSDGTFAIDAALPVNAAPTFAFGGGKMGKEFTSLGTSVIGRAAVELNPDGTIVVAGSISATKMDYAVARFQSDGGIDTRFSGDGWVSTDLYSTSAQAFDVAVQADGKIVVVGDVRIPGNQQFAVTRYNVDGSLDSGFDGDGIQKTDFGAGFSSAQSVAIQPDGKILVAGYAEGDFALARYNSDGSLDASFSGDGKLMTAIGSGNDTGESAIVQPDGKILVAGSSFNGSNYDFALARYEIDGSLDTSFSGDGMLTVAVGSGTDMAGSVQLQVDGKILVAGYASNGTDTDFALLRFNTDGNLDSSFGSGGKALADFGGRDDLGFAVALQADGKMLVGGDSRFFYSSDFALARFNTDGTLDASFAESGKVRADFNGTEDRAFDVELQSDGKILVAGNMWDGAIGSFALQRFNTDGNLDTSFGRNLTFTEGSAAIVMDSDVRIADAELALLDGGLGNYASATLTLARNGGANAQDVFSAKAAGTLGILAQGLSLTVGGITIGTVTTNNGGTLQLTFNSSATQSLVNSALQQIAYSNSSDTPPASAQINWTFSDGNTGAQGTGGALTATGSTMVSITSVNDAPVITRLNALLTVVEDGASVLPFAGLTISDIDNATLLSAFVQIEGWQPAGDMLSVIDLPGPLSLNFDTLSSTLTVSFAGPASIADFLTALHGFGLGSTTDALAGDRIVHLSVRDGVNTVYLPPFTIATQGVNDPASLAITPGGTLSIGAGQTLSPLAAVALGDPDGANLSGAVVSISDYAAGDLLSVNAGATGIASSFNGGTLTLTGTASTTQYQSVLASLTFQGSQPGVRSLSLSANDGSGFGTPTTLAVTVLANTLGTTGDDTLMGTADADALLGLAGNDTLTGGLGGDNLDGGTGFDTARYSGNRADYTIDQGTWYRYTITDNNPVDGNDGIDAVFGIERVQFADTSLSLQTSGSWHGFKHRPITPFWAGTDWNVVDSQRDFNGDSKNDLLLHKPDGSIALWLMDGSTRIAGVIFDPSPGRTLLDATTDYNGDGKTDLKWHEPDGSGSYWLMNSGWMVAI